MLGAATPRGCTGVGSSAASDGYKGQPNQDAGAHPLTGPGGAHLYGSEQCWLGSLPGAQVVLAPGLTEAMVRFAARFEYARSVEDVLARRNRLLFLDATAAHAVAPQVAEILSSEPGVTPQLAVSETLAKS